MADGLARYNSACKVCGKVILAGVHKTKWAPSIKGSSRHFECYGQPDKYPNASYHSGRVWNGSPDANGSSGQQQIPTESAQQQSSGGGILSESQQQPTTQQQNGGDAFAVMAQALAPHIERMISAKVDLSNVKGDIEDAVKAALRDHTKTIVLESRETGEREELAELTHRQLEELFETVRAGLRESHPEINPYLMGSAGGGKTFACAQLAKLLSKALNREMPFYHISLNNQSQPSLVMGYRNAAGEYVETDFFKWYTQGGVFLFDEYDNANGNFQTSLNTALTNGSCSFPHGIFPRHKDAICVAAGNTAMLGASDQYSSRNRADFAARERFVFIEWEYDAELERAAALAENPNAAPWINWVQTVRETVKRLDLKVVASPRSSIQGARLLRDGKFTPSKVADMVLFKGIDADTKAKILAGNPMPKVQTVQKPKPQPKTEAAETQAA